MSEEEYYKGLMKRIEEESKGYHCVKCGRLFDKEEAEKQFHQCPCEGLGEIIKLSVEPIIVCKDIDNNSMKNRFLVQGKTIIFNNNFEGKIHLKIISRDDDKIEVIVRESWVD